MDAGDRLSEVGGSNPVEAMFFDSCIDKPTSVSVVQDSKGIASKLSIFDEKRLSFSSCRSVCEWDAGLSFTLLSLGLSSCVLECLDEGSAHGLLSRGISRPEKHASAFFF